MHADKDNTGLFKVLVDLPCNVVELRCAHWTTLNSCYAFLASLTLWYESLTGPAYADLIGTRSTVLIGDFNSNAIWNAEHPAEHNHSAIVSRLDQLGCSSAYHEYFGEAHGSETRHTYFHWWKEERPFHIDYVFIPKLWLPRQQIVQ